jgi:signal-transduction protein with cAMP-binding, CBS, and nucleotidyltransferase domain
MRSCVYSSLLDRLPSEDRDQLSSTLRLVTLEQDQCLFEAGHAVTTVYFPVTAVIEETMPSLPDGARWLRQVDARSMAGSCVLGDPLGTRTARVSTGGTAYGMGYNDFVRALDEVSSFRELVMQDAVRACRV